MLTFRTPVVLLFGLVVALSPAISQDEKKQEPQEGPVQGPAKKPRDGGKNGQAGKKKKKKKGPEIPRLKKEELPKQTREKPDPAKSQHVRPPVYVRITEQATTEDGTMFVPEVHVVTNYLAEYFRRAGHPVVDDAEAAKYRVEGDVATTFEKVLKVRKETIAWKYIGDARIEVFDDQDERLDVVEFPAIEKLNVKSEKSAIWDLRRYLAHLTYQQLFRSGKIFTDKKVVGLLSSLTVDPFESEVEVTANEIIEQLADVGLPAVPYLLDALGDTNVVLVDARYPGLENPQDLKVYHIADKALEEIFQKVSRMGIRSPDRHRFLIMRGWEGEWRRFCKSFRESPEFRRRRDFLHRKAEGAVDPNNLRVLDFDVGDKKRGSKKGTPKKAPKSGEGSSGKAGSPEKPGAKQPSPAEKNSSGA